MKSVVFAAAAAALLASPALAQDAPQWSLAIHGGAGVIERAQLSPERDAAYRAGLQAALDAGSAVLARGGSALDAVQAAVETMEDNPLFNAGRGAVFTSAGKNELDAAVMSGPDLTAGAVAGLTRTRHPIAAARAVMEKSPHVMMIGEGAETFARSVGLEEVAPSWFFTESRWQALVRTLTERGEPVPPRPEGAPAEPARQGPAAPLAFNLNEAPLDERKFGTVGAVAMDSQGRLAAATSTGGTTGKRWGRVGDVPIIGAGTYASNADGCAVSATGAGEYFIRATVARDICQRTAEGASVQQAADAEIAEVGSIGGDGGVIVMGKDGVHAFSMNTSGMYRGAVSSTSPARVAIYGDEEGRR
ncbi:isoaspartyl peptidase/L-asparaginase [Brevundimonas naejangsanensis]|uniref:Isoaspartyl peptidase n=1 Tax=Brevundimonas naejangsanensis TaxID=588932 RepID=A0A494RKT0_9CAUL|nr:isoaspartyl peptidase/L-asparaginase [Brevundimonas naejangsanensis]AYG94346.1 isoaspartyl peptidase/L-asparaginase [Brevundimonas naejangsanensis]